MRRALLALAAFGALVACRKPSAGGGAGAAGDAAAPPVEQAAPAASSPAVVGARCRATDQVLSIDGGRAHDDLEIGDAVASAEGAAVGIVHRTGAGRVAGVGLLPPDMSALRIVDLGPTLGDAPPPRLAWRGKEVVAAWFGLPREGAHETTRELALATVGDGAKPLASVPQQRDDSLAFDLAYGASSGLLVWDEATVDASPRGVIRAAVLEGERAGVTHDVSPADSDAEAPRVVPVGSGFFVLWLARRPEPVGSPDASTGSEATGEARAYGWLEMIAVDAHGAVTGSVRRLTPTTGHVSAYDVQPLPAEAKPMVLVVARDDGESVDGSGGALLRVRVREDGAEPPLAFASDGLGRGAPSFVDAPPRADGAGSWLTWVGPHEQLRLLPLDASGAPVAAPSAEEALDEARPLLSLASGARLLVATPLDSAAQLRVFACPR